MDVSFAAAAGMGASRRGTRAIAQAGSIRVSGKWPSCSSAVWPPAGASITWLCTIVVPAGAVCACGAGSSGNATMAATAAADTFLRIGRFLSKTFSIRAASGRVSSEATRLAEANRPLAGAACSETLGCFAFWIRERAIACALTTLGRRYASYGVNACSGEHGLYFTGVRRLMMMRAPAIASPAPNRSVDVGRWPSTSHSQQSDAAM